MYGMQQLDGEILVDGGSQRVHMRSQKITLGRLIPPQLTLELGPGYDPVRILQQQNE
jgi:hypothetical protein